jgi:hypothetical protein
MWEKSHIEAGDFPDRSGQIPTPIPDSKPDKKQADAAASKTGQEPKVAAAVETVEIETLKEELGALDRQLVFDTTFYPKAAAYLAEERLGTSYLSWLYEECRKKNPDNLRGLYYVLFFQTDIRTVFRKQTRQKERVKARETVCPVCGMSYNARLTQCPGCSFNREDAGDENKIRRHKKYCELSPEDREAYELEQSKLFSRYAKNPACYAEIKDLWAAIEKKYHLRE